MARIEDGTSDLLQTLSNSGIHITYNSDNCDGTHYGTYRFIGMKREMHLCPGNSVDAIDHATVRHEAWHSVQHCVNTARGTSHYDPVAPMDELVDAVNTHLSEDTVNFVKANYDPSDWAVELEANLMEQLATAEQIEEIFIDACLGGNL